jgi:hypothetical protein
VRAVTAPPSLARGLLPAFLGLLLHAAPARAQTAASPSLPGTTDPAAAPPASDPAGSASAPSSSRLRAPDDQALPPPSARWNLLFTGLAVTGVSYGLVLGASYAWPDERNSSELRIPIAGPWMAIANTGCSEKDPDCSTVTLVFTAVLIGMDGVLQAGGLGLALESVLMKTATPKSRASTLPTLRPVPYIAGKDAMGLGLAGTF